MGERNAGSARPGRGGPDAGARPAADAVRVGVDLAVPPDQAFRTFTRDIGTWWRTGRDLASGAHPRQGVMDFEPGPHGRLWERHAGGADFEVGRIRAWEPPHRLVFEWRQGNFAPDETTVVEVRFAPAGSGGTRVTLEHRGWSAFAPDHPVRHGVVDGAFEGMMTGFWSELLDAFAALGTPA